MGWLWEALEELMEEGQDWIVVVLVGEQLVLFLLTSPSRPRADADARCGGEFAGMGIGLNAALISICTEWLSSVKLGHCTSGWWLNEKFCCLEADSTGEDTCNEWHEWGGGDPIAWATYVGCAVSSRSELEGREGEREDES